MNERRLAEEAVEALQTHKTTLPLPWSMGSLKWPILPSTVTRWLGQFATKTAGIAKLREYGTPAHVLLRFLDESRPWQRHECAVACAKSLMRLKVDEKACASCTPLTQASASMANPAVRDWIKAACWERHTGFCSVADEPNAAPVCGIVEMLLDAVRGVPKKDRWKKTFKLTHGGGWGLGMQREPGTAVYVTQLGGKCLPTKLGLVLCDIKGAEPLALLDPRWGQHFYNADLDLPLAAPVPS